ncbi:DUF3159 domain-containing protein [Arthrobacter sp. R-11]|uniref:DUF3159 domain-containing protein n=1 Tax=Arthrobacter sp. R-11 TaxID=3404053 RepID=UPI003CF9D710
MTAANGTDPDKNGSVEPLADAKPLPGKEALPGKDAEPGIAALAAGYAGRAGLQRNKHGHVDILKSAGGIQGIAESILPGLVFLIAFTITRELPVSLVAALAAAALFTIARLVQKRPLTQALAGIAGVAISAWLANTTGKAEDFYVLGFYTNAAYIAGMLLSILLKWPIAGLLFGFVRNEGLEWRKDPERLRAYSIATWVVIGVLALRLVVQVPLYLQGESGLAALATMRLIMGAPLYILGLWVAWLLSRPAGRGPAAAQPSKPSSSD